jgi:hypothetical protein
METEVRKATAALAESLSHGDPSRARVDDRRLPPQRALSPSSASTATLPECAPPSTWTTPGCWRPGRS